MHGYPEDDGEPNKEGYVNVLDRDSFASVQRCLAIAVDRIEHVDPAAETFQGRVQAFNVYLDLCAFVPGRGDRAKV